LIISWSHKNLWRYHKRWKSYRIDEQTNQQTNRQTNRHRKAHYSKHSTWLRYQCVGCRYSLKLTGRCIT